MDNEQIYGMVHFLNDEMRNYDRIDVNLSVLCAAAKEIGDWASIKGAFYFDCHLFFA